MATTPVLTAGKFLRTPYVPGQAGDKGLVRLNVNEVPWPSPRLESSADSADARYPDPAGDPLVRELADFHGLAPDNFFVGCGADGVLDSVIRAFVGANSRVVLTKPTYALVPSMVEAYQGNVDWIDWNPAMRISGSAEDTVIVTNPNAPTGEFIPVDRLERSLGSFDGLVIVDEAYVSYAPESALAALPRNRNWVIVRSFSKEFGLAGLRVGHGMASPELIARVRQFALPYPVSRRSLEVSSAALRDRARHGEIVRAVVEGRRELHEQLSARGWSLTSSEANFVFGSPPGPPARVTRLLEERGVLVRHFSGNGPEGIRVSVGTARERDVLYRALDDMREGVRA